MACHTAFVLGATSAGRPEMKFRSRNDVSNGEIGGIRTIPPPRLVVKMDQKSQKTSTHYTGRDAAVPLRWIREPRPPRTSTLLHPLGARAIAPMRSNRSLSRFINPAYETRPRTFLPTALAPVATVQYGMRDYTTATHHRYSILDPGRTRLLKLFWPNDPSAAERAKELAPGLIDRLVLQARLRQSSSLQHHTVNAGRV